MASQRVEETALDKALKSVNTAPSFNVLWQKLVSELDSYNNLVQQVGKEIVLEKMRKEQAEKGKIDLDF
jgi:hypothetical protein